MGITPSHPKDFDFYDNERLHFFCCPPLKSNSANTIEMSIIKQKERSGKITVTYLFSLYIYKK